MNYISYMTIGCFQYSLRVTRLSAKVTFLGGHKHGFHLGARSLPVGVGQGKILWCEYRFLPTDSGVKTNEKKGFQPKLRRDLVVWMLVPAHRFMGEDQKKAFVTKSKVLP